MGKSIGRLRVKSKITKLFRGPQSGQIHGVGSVYYGEMQAELILNLIRRVIEGNYRNVTVKQSVFDQWVKNYDNFVKTNK